MSPPINIKFSSYASNVDHLRRAYILKSLCYMSTTILIYFGFDRLNNELFNTAIGLLFFGVMSLVTLVYYKATQDIDRAALLASSFTIFLATFLIYTGGYNNTALLWIFPIIVSMFALNTLKIAIAVSLIILCLATIMIYNPQFIEGNYADEYKLRFILSALNLTILCAVSQHFREKSHRAMDELQMSKQLEANTDPLTQLVNRRFIESHLLENMRSSPNQFFPLGVIMCDIDHFKKLNDSLGHDAGDQVLVSFANLFKANLREMDIACRMGGEEFALFLPKATLKESQRVAEKLRATIELSMPHIFPDYPKITASFGVAQCDQAQQFNAVIKAADVKLYQAKRAGRNQVI